MPRVASSLSTEQNSSLTRALFPLPAEMPKDGRGGDFSTLVNASLPIGCPYVCAAVYFIDAAGKYRLKVVFEHEHDDASFTFRSTSIMFKNKRRDAVGEQAWLDTLNVDYWAERCPQLTGPGVEVDGAGADSFAGADDMEVDSFAGAARLERIAEAAATVSPTATSSSNEATVSTDKKFSPKRPRIEEEEDPDDAQPSSSPLSPALLITSPPSPPSSSGPSSTGEWFRFLRFLFISLKHAAFSALHPSMPTRPRVFHPRSTTVHLLCLWLIPLSVRITLYCIRISPCCRRAVLPPCRGRNDRKEGGGLVRITCTNYELIGVRL